MAEQKDNTNTATDAKADRFACKDEWAPVISRCQLAKNLIWPLIVVLCINFAFVLKIKYKPLLWHDYVASYKQQLASETYSPPLELLILGDSTGNQAVQASLYEKLKMPGRNLCTFANITLAGDAWLLDEYLKNNPPPKYVVLVHAARALPWQQLEKGMLHRFPVRKDSDFKADISAAQEFDAAINYWLPLCYSRNTIQKCYRKPWRIFTEFDFCEWDYSGCMYFDQNLSEQVKSSVSRHLELLGNNPTLSDLNTKALTHMLNKAREYGFKIGYVPAPVYEGLYNSGNFAELNTKLLKNMQETFVDYTDVFTVDTNQQLATFDQMGAFAVHVNSKGAEVFTSKLTHKLSELFDGHNKLNHQVANAFFGD